MLKAYLAVDKNHGIANSEGQIPWRIPADTQRLWKLVEDECSDVLISRSSWAGIPESRKEKLLGSKVVHIWTRTAKVDDERLKVVNDLAAWLPQAEKRSVAVLGGLLLYKTLWDDFNTIDYTLIQHDFGTTMALPVPNRAIYGIPKLLDIHDETDKLSGAQVNILQLQYDRLQNQAAQ